MLEFTFRGKTELAANGHRPLEHRLPSLMFLQLNHTAPLRLTHFLLVQGLGEQFPEVFWEASTHCRQLGHREALRTFWLGLELAPTCLCPLSMEADVLAKLHRAFWVSGRHLLRF